MNTGDERLIIKCKNQELGNDHTRWLMIPPSSVGYAVYQKLGDVHKCSRELLTIMIGNKVLEMDKTLPEQGMCSFMSVKYRIHKHPPLIFGHHKVVMLRMYSTRLVVTASLVILAIFDNECVLRNKTTTAALKAADHYADMPELADDDD